MMYVCMLHVVTDVFFCDCMFARFDVFLVTVCAFDVAGNALGLILLGMLPAYVNVIFMYLRCVVFY